MTVLTIVVTILGVISLSVVVAFIIMSALVFIRLAIDAIKDLKKEEEPVTPHDIDESGFYIGQRVSLKGLKPCGVTDGSRGTIMSRSMNEWYIVNTDKPNVFNHEEFNGNGLDVPRTSITAIEGENNEK